MFVFLINPHHLYFYVKTKDDVKGDFASQNWITLLLDTDEDVKTGANGNDFVVYANPEENRFVLLATVNQDGQNTIDASVEKIPIDCKLVGSELELKVPVSALRVDRKKPVFRFKWTDGVDILGEWSGFTTNGDCAPNDRYYYRYVAP